MGEKNKKWSLVYGTEYSNGYCYGKRQRAFIVISEIYLSNTCLEKVTCGTDCFTLL